MNENNRVVIALLVDLVAGFVLGLGVGWRHIIHLDGSSPSVIDQPVY